MIFKVISIEVTSAWSNVRKQPKFGEQNNRTPTIMWAIGIIDKELPYQLPSNFGQQRDKYTYKVVVFDILMVVSTKIAVF
jgi:hypothetical protein